MLRHAAKSFGAVQALIDGSIELYAGEAHALVGENGAGKSTLVKILAGVHQPDAGCAARDDREVTLHGPAAAHAAGIAVIYQEPALFPDLTVAENMFIGRQPLGSGRRIDRRAMQAEAAAIFARLGVPLDPAPDRPRAVHRRPAGRRDRQGPVAGRPGHRDGRADRRAVRRRGGPAVRRGPRRCAPAGAAVLFISHRLEEVFAICQRVTVMRDGRHVLTSELAGLTADDLVRAMVGPGDGRPAGRRARRPRRARCSAWSG